MKNWLKNLKIKGKLDLMIGVSIICILLFGLVSIFMIRTTKVMNIMLIAQRSYMIEYHQSLEYFYQFKSQPDQISLIAKADSIISQSNAKLELFSNLDAFFIDYNKDKGSLTKKVATTYFDALSGDNEGHFTPTDPGYETLKSARFLIKRMHLFYRIQPKILDQTSAATHLAHQYAMNIQSEYSSILANPSQTDFNLVEAKMKEPLNKMSIQETTFANNVKQMSI
ncbi:MAG: hypothetical protein PHY99_09210, partial [Bacteroidales bacterium]|nr:hypothetical protein [Bacteroidales bacterium]